MNAASVKGRLTNIAKESGRTFQDVLVSYALERTLYRLSVSNYKDRFILKGGIFLYALFKGNYPRATVDIDLLAKEIGNDPNNIRDVFNHIFAIKTDDPLTFDFASLEVKNITEQSKYHGVNVSIIAYLDKTRIPVSVDIGFGDVVYPDKVLMEFPVLLSDDPPRVYAYSVYSSIAEKFEAIVSLGYDNSRFKDFYDIYINAVKFDFDGQTLLEAFTETFEQRGTDIDFIAAFSEDYAKDAVRLTRWKNFVRKKKVLSDFDLEETVEVIKLFVAPVVEAMRNKETISARWIGKDKKWIYTDDVQNNNV